MAKIGHLVDGKFVTVAQDFDVLDAPECTQEQSRLMSVTDKKKLDKVNIASVEDIEAIFI